MAYDSHPRGFNVPNHEVKTTVQPTGQSTVQPPEQSTQQSTRRL